MNLSKTTVSRTEVRMGEELPQLQEGSSGLPRDVKVLTLVEGDEGLFMGLGDSPQNILREHGHCDARLLAQLLRRVEHGYQRQHHALAGVGGAQPVGHKEYPHFFGDVSPAKELVHRLDPFRVVLEHVSSRWAHACRFFESLGRKV